MKILQIMEILFAVVAVVSAAGYAEMAQVAGNETPKASEQLTTVAVPTTSVAESVPSVTPSAMNNTDLTSSTVVDVVCKMKIDKRTAEFTSKKGTTYYFCALSCKNEFDENPEKYINSEITENEIQEAPEQVMSATTDSTGSKASTVVDVVCKMKIDKRTAEFKSEYKGTTYYFCALSCKEEFDENPEKYINSETAENNPETTEDETQEASEQVTSVATNSVDSTSSTVVDVVCKMKIDRRTAEFTSEYKGTTYYFCALSCKEKFDANPDYYINSKTTENNSETAEDGASEASEQATSAVMNSADSTSSTVVDVVCKMKIDRRTAEFTSEYKGTTYYFCSASCKKEFDENPKKYISSETTENETQKSCKTTENKTQEASEQVTPVTTNSTDSKSSTVVDVVCKMKIDKRTAEFTSEYKGTIYYFCALSCKNEFDEKPEKYIGYKTTENNSEITEDETQKNCNATENKTAETSEQVMSTTNDADSTSSTIVDVVCKMKIDKRKAEFTSEYKGITYYFCSASCKKEFNKNLNKYINPKTAENNSEITEDETPEASEQVTPATTNDTYSTSSTVVDAVCKMEIDKRTAEFTSKYKGTTYYFCALSCKKEFDGNPEKYIGSETTE